MNSFYELLLSIWSILNILVSLALLNLIIKYHDLVPKKDNKSSNNTNNNNKNNIHKIDKSSLEEISSSYSSTSTDKSSNKSIKEDITEVEYDDVSEAVTSYNSIKNQDDISESLMKLSNSKDTTDEQISTIRDQIKNSLVSKIKDPKKKDLVSDAFTLMTDTILTSFSKDNESSRVRILPAPKESRSSGEKNKVLQETKNTPSEQNNQQNN